MLLAIDIGNSNTKFGLFKEGKLEKKLSIKTIRHQSPKEIYSQIIDLLPDRISGAIISTVVKELKQTYQEFGEKYFKINSYFADHNSPFDLSIKYFPPENCGSDRLVAAFAAVEKYGSPVIVCDFGTATNIEVVNKKNEYLGGVIAPGPNTLGSALFEKTSKLPKVDFKKPDSAIGNSTITSIQSGIYYGYIGLVDEIIRKIQKELGENAKIISTGGFAETIAQDSKFVKKIDKNLVLEGLYLLKKKMDVPE